jgi:hypothetical protein
MEEKEREIELIISKAAQDAERIFSDLSSPSSQSSPQLVGAAIARELRLLRAELAALRLTMTASEPVA